MFEIIPFSRKTCVPSYNPFREMEEMSKNFFGSFTPYFSKGSLEPFRTDVKETDTAFELEADLPGFNKEDIDIGIEGDTLTIKAERHSDHENKDEKNNYVRVERSYGSYSRSFDITGVDADAITAKYENGVLSLNLPKKEPVQPEVKKLTIQ